MPLGSEQDGLWQSYLRANSFALVIGQNLVKKPFVEFVMYYKIQFLLLLSKVLDRFV